MPLTLPAPVPTKFHPFALLHEVMLPVPLLTHRPTAALAPPLDVLARKARLVRTPVLLTDGLKFRVNVLPYPSTPCLNPLVSELWTEREEEPIVPVITTVQLVQ